MIRWSQGFPACLLTALLCCHVSHAAIWSSQMLISSLHLPSLSTCPTSHWGRHPLLFQTPVSTVLMPRRWWGSGVLVGGAWRLILVAVLAEENRKWWMLLRFKINCCVCVISFSEHSWGANKGKLWDARRSPSAVARVIKSPVWTGARHWSEKGSQAYTEIFTQPASNGRKV